MALNIPTIRLLSTSILVALSGVFKLYIVSLFLGIELSAPVYLSFFLVIYATYTLDRALDCEEDKINRKELVSSRKDIALIVCLISLITASILLFRENLLFIAFLPFAIGYVYSRGLRIGNSTVKLKGNFGMKNLTVALTWGLTIFAIAQQCAGISRALLFVFPFFAVKSFINTVIYDFRDVEGDRIGGLKTLPVCLGVEKTQELLQIMHILLHLWVVVIILLDLVYPEIVLFLVSWFSGMVYTIVYTTPPPADESRFRKIMRDVLVDGEFIMAVFIKQITGF